MIQVEPFCPASSPDTCYSVHFLFLVCVFELSAAAPLVINHSFFDTAEILLLFWLLEQDEQSPVHVHGCTLPP